MDMEQFNQLVLQVHAGQPLSPAEKTLIRDELPLMLGGLEQIFRIRAYDHPAGVHIKDAPVRTYLSAYSLLLGKKAHGTGRFIGKRFFDDLERHLSMGVMRANFEQGHPKGFYCCKVCSLAVLPLFEMDLLDSLSGRQLGVNLRRMITQREGRFAGNMPAPLLRFALSFGGTRPG